MQWNMVVRNDEIYCNIVRTGTYVKWRKSEMDKYDMISLACDIRITGWGNVIGRMPRLSLTQSIESRSKEIEGLRKMRKGNNGKRGWGTLGILRMYEWYSYIPKATTISKGSTSEIGELNCSCPTLKCTCQGERQWRNEEVGDSIRTLMLGIRVRENENTDGER